MVGAFNWRVQVGDRTSIIDYGWQKDKLTRERSDAGDRLVARAAAVGQHACRTLRHAGARDGRGCGGNRRHCDDGPVRPEGPHSFAPLPLVFSALLVILNMKPLFSFSGRSVYLLIGLLVLWLPEWLWKRFASDGATRDPVHPLRHLWPDRRHAVQLRIDRRQRSGGSGWGSSSARSRYSSYGSHK